MEQKRPRRPTHAEDEELAAITREIHAQLRALYPEPADEAAMRSRAAGPGASRRGLSAARALAAFVLPPAAMIGLAVLLHALLTG